METTGFIQKPDPRNILDLPQDDMMRALETTGAMNAAPALARSTHLKNKVTGIVLPWNPLLAEQRDIMENCDANGNTDPAAWEGTVNPEEYTEEDRERDYWDARNTVVREAMRMQTPYRTSPHETSIPKSDGQRLPRDVQTLDEYYDQLNKLDRELEF